MGLWIGWVIVKSKMVVGGGKERREGIWNIIVKVLVYFKL